jgi:ATP-dependent protease HslVU (ClpYQ) peptidase subunit
MSKAVSFTLDLKGLNTLMKSEEMCSILNDAAAKIVAAAGDGFEAEGAHPISFVGITYVKAATPDALRRARNDNALEIAAGGARI